MAATIELPELNPEQLKEARERMLSVSPGRAFVSHPASSSTPTPAPPTASRPAPPRWVPTRQTFPERSCRSATSSTL